MKKTLTLLAILAAIGPAWAADVVSSNVVGYQKLTVKKGLNLLIRISASCVSVKSLSFG